MLSRVAQSGKAAAVNIGCSNSLENYLFEQPIERLLSFIESLG
jgi:hypothetical protein